MIGLHADIRIGEHGVGADSGQRVVSVAVGDGTRSSTVDLNAHADERLALGVEDTAGSCYEGRCLTVLIAFVDLDIASFDRNGQR